MSCTLAVYRVTDRDLKLGIILITGGMHIVKFKPSNTTHCRHRTVVSGRGEG